jgi:hypothetical protein
MFPEAIANYWKTTTIADLWQGNNLHLRIRDGDYGRRTMGEGVSTRDGFRSVHAVAGPKQSGFQAKIRDSREDLWIAFKDLAEYSAGDGYEIRPFTILDFCLRETRADRALGYRMRFGYIPSDGLEDLTGSATEGYLRCETKEEVITQPVQRLGNGFTFRFMEIDKAGFY